MIMLTLKILLPTFPHPFDLEGKGFSFSWLYSPDVFQRSNITGVNRRTDMSKCYSRWVRLALSSSKIVCLRTGYGQKDNGVRGKVDQVWCENYIYFLWWKCYSNLLVEYKLLAARSFWRLNSCLLRFKETMIWRKGKMFLY